MTLQVGFELTMEALDCTLLLINAIHKFIIKRLFIPRSHRVTDSQNSDLQLCYVKKLLASQL